MHIDPDTIEGRLLYLSGGIFLIALGVEALMDLEAAAFRPIPAVAAIGAGVCALAVLVMSMVQNPRGRKPPKGKSR